MEGFYSATKHGIVNDGVTNNTTALNELLKQIAGNGGGTLYLSPGRYLTGSLLIGDNTTLYIEGGAVIMGSADKSDYPMIDDDVIPGWGEPSHRGLIAAHNASNIAIIGRGTIDGQGQNWWSNPKGGYRPRAVEPISCDNVLIRDITVINSPMWTLHPLCCNNVTIDGVTIKNPANSPNTDGINPESCSNVHISNCHIDVGDDCITLKSGRQDDNFRRLRPCENITITNCTMLNGHGGVVIGSEMSGGVRHVTISNCVFNGTDRGIRIKTRRKRGGTVEDIRISNIIMTDVFCPLVLNGFYMCDASADDMSLFTKEKLPINDGTPAFKDIYISNITARDVHACALFVYGIPESPVQGLHINDFHVSMKKGEVEPRQAAMIHGLAHMAKAGIKLTNVEDVTLNNIHVDLDKADNPLHIDSSKDVNVLGLYARNVPENAEIRIENCENVNLSECRNIRVNEIN